MQRIFKYQLQLNDKQEIELPLGSEILCVQVQNDVPCIWVNVYDGHPKIMRYFEIIGTGNSIPLSGDKRKYIGTFQLEMGSFVGHLFEIIKH